MKNESEIRVCKNKKCQKVLPAGYIDKYCEACRNQQAQTAKNVLEWFKNGTKTVAGIAVAIVTGIVTVRNILSKK